MEQQGTCGLDFEGGPGNCGAIAYDSHSEDEAFMLTEDQPAKLDIVQMLGDRRREEEAGG
jgi:hypothetical protein